MNNIVISVFILSVFLGLNLSIALVFRVRLRNTLTHLCVPALAVFNFLLIGTAIAWCMSLLPPLNDSDSPILLGIGGSEYGTNYALYPTVALYYGATAFVATVFVFIASWLFRPLPQLNVNLKSQLERIPVGLVSIALLVISVLSFIAYFSNVGWERLWSSGLDRFEGSARFSFFLFDARIFQLVWLLTGLGFVALVYRGGATIRDYIGFLFTVMPLFVLSSRMATLLVFGLLTVLVIRIRKPTVYFLLPLVLFIAFMSAIVPLRSRGYPGSGLRVVATAAVEVFTSDRYSMSESAVALLQNLGQGFPVFAEAIDRGRSGSSIREGVPSAYFLLAFSPAPSFVDGYARNYHQYRNMLNAFTPFNAYSELQAISVLLLFVFPALVLMMFLLMLRLSWAQGALWGVIVVILIFGFLGYHVYAQQYLLRQATRYFFYSIELSALILITQGIFFGSGSPSARFKPVAMPRGIK